MELDIVVVDDARGVQEVADALWEAERIAIDTESNSLHVYKERVCFVQIMANGRVFLIDTVAIRDLEPLIEPLADTSSLKLLHGADYDVVCLRRDFDFQLTPIFDTMIAANMLGYEQFGLAALVERHFGAELDKSLSRHDWGRRPLEDRYVPYLVDDVIFLERLHDVLCASLEDADLVEEAEIEFDRVSAQQWSGKEEPDPERFRKIKGARDLDQTGLSILKQMYFLRDRVAREADVPPFRVLGNEQLLTVAKRRPKDHRDLKRIRGFTDRVLRKIGKDTLRAVREGIETKSSVPLRPKPRGERPPEVQVMVDEGLRQWRRGEVKEREVPSIVVLPNHVVERIARARPTSLDALGEIQGLGDKRLQRYGDAILEIVRNPPPLRRRR